MNAAQAQRRLQSGIQHLQAGDFAGAEKDFRTVLKADKRNFAVLNLLAIVLMQQRRFADAESFLKSACVINPSNAATIYNYGLTLNELGRPHDALVQFDKVVALEPANADAWNSRGLALKARGGLADALESYDKAVALRSDHADTHYNIGNALQAAGRLEAALESYDRAIALNSGHADAYCNRANVLQDLRRFDDALASVDRAIALRPALPLAHYNRGGILKTLERYEDALVSFDRAIALKADYAEAYQNRGSVFASQHRYAEAIDDFDVAITLQPGNIEAHYNKGVALLSLGRQSEAAASFNRAFSLDSSHLDALTLALHAEMQSCDWHDYQAKVSALTDALTREALAVQPFTLFPTPASRQMLKRAAEAWTRKAHPPVEAALWNGTSYGHKRPRVGYFSADFRNHATAYLVAELFERHDRAKFEFHAFSFGPDFQDSMRERIRAAFEHFHEVSGQKSVAIAALARKLEIDIAVDLKGLTAAARPEIFAMRPAPVQVNWLGFPGTMGAPYIDYIIADDVLIPPEHAGSYSEKIVHLPHSYQVNDRKRAISDIVPPREALGLPERGFVFCCLNHNYKITPDVFGVWMRLLAGVPGSALWLLEDNATARKNLHAEAKNRGIATERLVFAPRIPLEDHLARQRRADLFLDTFYCNAHTTASDALWVGLPVVTRLGDTFASRVAASLLNAVGLPELVVATTEQYEALALQLAANQDAMAAIRAKLASHRESLPLFNATLFARHIEEAYAQMWRRQQQGLPPEHLTIAE